MNPTGLPKVTFVRHYDRKAYCAGRELRRSRLFPCKNCPISHDHEQYCRSGHTSCFKKPSNLSKCSVAKNNASSNIGFDFFKAAYIIQKRFVELASPYEKYKLQHVSQQLYNFIPANTSFEVYEKLVINKDVDANQCDFGRYLNGIYLNPLDQIHFDKIWNILINNEIVGCDVPDDWIQKLCDQNVTFYLESVRMERCNLSAYEIYAISSFGAVQYLYLDKIVATTPVSMKCVASFLKNATRIWIDVKNMEFEYDWPMAFLDGNNILAKMNWVTLKNLSFNMDVRAFDEFIKKRIIQDKNEVPWAKYSKKIQIDCVMTISFNEDEIVGKKSKKGFVKKINNIFAGYYMSVPKTEFEKFKLNHKFVVERLHPCKEKWHPYQQHKTTKIDRYFYVTCDGVPNNEMGKLRI